MEKIPIYSLYIGVRGNPYVDIFSWAGGMGGGEMGDSSVAVAAVAVAVAPARKTEVFCLPNK